MGWVWEWIVELVFAMSFVEPNMLKEETPKLKPVRLFSYLH
jgi:hypothetical protein